ncbi:MAG TPA: hypothetical protein VLJ18_08570 [Thermoanaerobaculia bacterium]|nr:hypothetical protein [Thermoanaerobaculia bacterium]
MRRGRTFSFLFRFLPIAAMALPNPVRAAAPSPALAPWLKIFPGDARVGRLAALPAAPLSPNAPGLLLKLGPEGWRAGNTAARDAVRSLATNAHRKGWRWGLDLELPDAKIPVDVRAAEAATVEDLWPGLGGIFRDAKETDLVTIGFPDTRIAGIHDFGRPQQGTFDPKARSYLLRKAAAGTRAAAPHARIVFAAGPVAHGELAPRDVKQLFSEENAAYVDFVGVTPLAGPAPGQIRVAVDDMSFGKPALVDLEFSGATSPGALLAAAARLAPENVPFVVATPAWDPSKDAALERFARLLDGDFGIDSRAATASAAGGEALDVFRFVERTDLGGVVLVPGTSPASRLPSGAFTLTLDETAYASAEVFELATGASKKFEIPARSVPARLSLSLGNGPLGVRLLAREKLPSEAAKAAVGVAVTRGLTADEILAKHQAWRAARDARWKALTARSTMSMRFRFAELNNTFDLALAGPFFYEKGGSYDWAWSEAYFNGVRWKGKKIPELPLLQPEKVSDMPLALTFDDAYVYTLAGEDTVNRIPCWALDFTPRASASDKPLYAGTVWVAKADFAAIRTRTRQLNLTAEIQAVDEVSDFGEVPAPDGGPPLRLPTHTTGQWILKTFSRTTVVERESTLSNVRLDPPDFAAERQAAFASPDVMVRDTEKGVRYLEKTKDGGRVVTEDTKRTHLFGVGGVFYDSSFDYPLPLLGVYYVDLDFHKRHEQLQVFFGGVLLAASYNQPRLFGTAIDAGVDLFGIAIRGSDALFVGGTEDKTQRVKSRSFAGNFKAGIPLGRHVKISATLGEIHRDFAADDTETSPSFVIPSDHWVTRLEGQAVWDLRGWALSGRFAWSKRSRWDPWGFALNPDYDPGKDEFRTYSVQLAKDFHLPRFQRIQTSISYLGSSNTDRFSKYSFGFFGGTSLRGFRSGALRAEEAVTSRFAYGYVFGDVFRLEVVYDDARVKDLAAGLDWAYFSGAGLSGEVPGPWSTLVRFDAGTPVAGRNRGQTGFVVSLTFLKIF